jgi:CRP-like cAMP-binding protein
MDRNIQNLLTSPVLTLAFGLTLHVPHSGRLIVKYQLARRHLVVTPLQWKALKVFETGRTVPAALKQLIQERSCIALHDFYELVLQAQEAGILQLPAQIPLRAEPPTPWPYNLSSRITHHCALVLGFLLVTALFITPVSAPSHPLWWLLGWFLLCGAISAGNWLAASVLHAAGGDVYLPRWHWKSFFPRYEVDLSDAQIAGPETEVDCALMRMMPRAALTAITAQFAPMLTLPCLCGLLWALAPLRRTPIAIILRALHHVPRLSSSRHNLFPRNRLLIRRLRRWKEPDELRFALIQLGYGLTWLFLLALVWVATTSVNTADVATFVWKYNTPTIWLFLVFALVVVVLLVATLLLFVCLVEEKLRFNTKKQASVKTLIQSDKLEVPSLLRIHEFLGETHPFSLIPPTQRIMVAQAMQVLQVSRGTMIANAGDPTPVLRILYAGTVEQIRAGLVKVNLKLTVGSVLGEAALLHLGGQTDALVASTDCIVLCLGQADYRQLVQRFVPSSQLADSAQKLAFLRSTALSRQWPAIVLIGFARCATLHTFASGDTLLRDGKENLYFYILMDGELRVRKNGRQIARLRSGDYFGEISLLQNSATTAEIYGHRPGHFLAVSKNDFIELLVQDNSVAMQFERIASVRLGRPIFTT